MNDHILTLMFCFLDGERCAETIKSIFENAKNPDKIMVGLIEEAAPEDKYCLEQYCDNQGKLVSSVLV